jgi:hypothetical protein
VRDHFSVAPADEVQLLIRADAKPRPGKAKCRTRHGREPEHVAIKGDALVEIGDVQGDVVELGGQHGDFGFPIADFRLIGTPF